MDTSTTCLHIKWKVPAAKHADFIAALKIAFEEVKKHPSIQYINVFQDTKDNDIFKIVEIWNMSMEELSKADAKPWVAPFMKAAEEMGASAVGTPEILNPVGDFKFVKR